MTVSVIIPTKNSAAVISEAMNSLKVQDCQDFEVIIKDAWSSDDTLLIVGKFSEFFGSRLVINSEEDGGIYDAMNKAITISKGEWIYFLGSDDRIYDEHVISDVRSILLLSKPDFLYGRVFQEDIHEPSGEHTTIHNLLFERNIWHQSIFYSRRLFEVMGKFNTFYPIWADWDFNIRCFKNPTLKALYFDRIVAYYKNEGGASAMADPEFIKELPLFIVKKYEDELKMANRSFLSMCSYMMKAALRRLMFYGRYNSYCL